MPQHRYRDAVLQYRAVPSAQSTGFGVRILKHLGSILLFISKCIVGGVWALLRRLQEEDDPRMGGQWRETPRRAAGGFDPERVLGEIKVA